MRKFWEQAIRFWKYIAAVLGAVTAIVQFIQLWQGYQSTVTWVIAGMGWLIVVGFLVYVLVNKETIPTGVMFPTGEEQRRPYYSPRQKQLAGLGLALMLLGALTGTALLLRHRARLQAQFTIVIARFDGPEEAYGVRDELLERLREAFAEDPEVRIVALDKVVTTAQGSAYARGLGKKHLADLMLWGWYRPTENPNLTLHVENFLPPKTTRYLPEILETESLTLRPAATLVDLKHFTLQVDVSQELGALVAVLQGLSHYGRGAYERALQAFNKAADLLPETPRLLGERWAALFFYRGNAYADLGQYEQAIADYNQAIQINPQDAEAYNNRGIAYADLGQYEQATADYNQALQINPQLAEAYYNRGNAYYDLGQYEQAIADYTQAIQINPQLAKAYHNRGVTYAHLGQYEQAIADFKQALVLCKSPNVCQAAQKGLKAAQQALEARR